MIRLFALCLFASITMFTSFAQAQPTVGPTDTGTIVPTTQLLRPAGQTIPFAGRPVDIALSPDGQWLYAKDNRGLVVFNTQTWTLAQKLNTRGGSMTGLAVSPDGSRIFATSSRDELIEYAVDETGTVKETRRIILPGPGGKSNSFPCGLALTKDGSTAFVALSVNNTLAEVSLGESPTVVREIPVGIAPFDVALTPDGKTALVTDWGGRRPEQTDMTAPSAGTATVVDERGIAASGGLSIVNLEDGSEQFVATGLSACGLAVSDDGRTAVVANANSDSVSVVDIAGATVTRQIIVKPDAKLPFGSMPNALTIHDGKLLVALAGNNAIAVVDPQSKENPILGLIPTDWFPGGVLTRGDTIYIANIKGVGSRSKDPNRPGYNSHQHRGSVQKLAIPTAAVLADLTSKTILDARVPQALRALEAAASDAPPVAVPASPGQPSVIKHCVYIIKENRTYDQVLGDIGRGNSDPSLCIYGRDVTPNHHALVDEFVLLDNYYCNGVLSADGHSWATEGNVTPYLERSFGGFTRSYTFGDDPLTYSSSGFIWDAVLAAGLSFRNYGEFNYAGVKPKASYPEILEDWNQARANDPGGTQPGALTFTSNIGVENLRRYSCPDSPGWNMDIPDQIRADVFLSELEGFVEQGSFPNLVIIYLPEDHTSGTGEGHPTPRALVADNDLAVGRIVEALSNTPFWKDMAIFINEDDPQNGFDHVDGHRSFCLVVSPYTRRGGKLISNFYNQSSVVHTIWRILGITARNQNTALAPLMTDCFTDTPDLTPYAHRPANIDLTEMNPPKSSLGPRERHLAELSENLDLALPDRADEDTLNRILWHAARGIDTPYPARFAGAHGRGLPKLGLRFAKDGEIDLDDDD
jgi:YVTN family beta-propeller protein